MSLARNKEEKLIRQFYELDIVTWKNFTQDLNIGYYLKVLSKVSDMFIKVVISFLNYALNLNCNI